MLVRVRLYVIHNCIPCEQFTCTEHFIWYRKQKDERWREKKEKWIEIKEEKERMSQFRNGTFFFHLKHSDLHTHTHTQHTSTVHRKHQIYNIKVKQNVRVLLFFRHRKTLARRSKNERERGGERTQFTFKIIHKSRTLRAHHKTATATIVVNKSKKKEQHILEMPKGVERQQHQHRKM